MFKKDETFSLIFLALFLFINFFNLSAQNDEYLFQSVIVDNKLEAIGGAYVKNLNSNEIAISNASGGFSIKCSASDSLIISAMGYELEKVYANAFDRAYIQLNSMIHTLKQVNVYDFKTWESFKKEFLEADIPGEKVNIDGLPAGKPSKKPVGLRSNEFSQDPNVVNYILNPFSSLAYYLNDDEKSKRKVWRLMNIENRDAIYWRVMHADSIKAWVNIPDSMLDEFVLYCNLKIEDKSSQVAYDYKEKISELYPLFLEERKK